jgi:ATP-dependent Clp protease ATP-binding subunit ClpC
MTSNVGARDINRDTALGFRNQEGIMNYNDIKSSAMSELKRAFNPEFLNRIDEIVVFHSLKKVHLEKILDIMIAEIEERVLEMHIALEFRRKAKEFLIEKGYDEKYGARPLRRTLQKDIEDPLSLEMLKGKFKSGDHIIVDVRNDKIVFRLKKQRQKEESEKKLESIKG